MNYRDELSRRMPIANLIRSYEGISFSPVKRGNDEFEGVAAWIEEIMPQLASDDERERVMAGFCKRWAAYVAARGRTMSPMISGPARFPVARNEKALNSEHKRLNEYLDYQNRIRGMIAKRNAPPSAVISSDDPNAVARLNEKLAKVMEEWASAKRWNAQFRKGGVAAMDCGEALKAATEKLMKDCTWLSRPFDLSRYSSEAKRINDRIAQLDRRATQCTDERQVGDIRIIADPNANRVRIIFPGKPSADKRQDLKRAGFRWAPSEGAWQRFYSAEAIRIAERIAA